MANVEELDPKPFISLLNVMGLPTRIQDEDGDRAAQERPLREIMAEQPPGLGHRVRAFHVNRPVRHHQARIGRPVLHGLRSQQQPFGLKCGDQEAGLAGVRMFSGMTESFPHR
jgi:hypothetical protein